MTDVPPSGTQLHVQIALGKVKASMEYEFHKILVVDSDPIAIVVSDDWSRATTDAAELELDFQVKMGSFNIIATTSTIPTLVSVTQRVSTLIEEKGAQADATIAAAGLPPRPSTARKGENVVAAVASTLAQESLTAGDCPVRVINHLDIELVRIRVAIFPERFNEGEVYRLDAGSTIRAQLVRGVGSDDIINRDLQLYLGFFVRFLLLHFSSKCSLTSLVLVAVDPQGQPSQALADAREGAYRSRVVRALPHLKRKEHLQAGHDRGLDDLFPGRRFESSPSSLRHVFRWTGRYRSQRQLRHSEPERFES